MAVPSGSALSTSHHRQNMAEQCRTLPNNAKHIRPAYHSHSQPRHATPAVPQQLAFSLLLLDNGAIISIRTFNTGIAICQQTGIVGPCLGLPRFHFCRLLRNIRKLWNILCATVKTQFMCDNSSQYPWLPQQLLTIPWVPQKQFLL